MGAVMAKQTKSDAQLIGDMATKANRDLANETMARQIYIERVSRMPTPHEFSDENIAARLEEHAFFSLEAAGVFDYASDGWFDD
jgi:hypothetical protein